MLSCKFPSLCCQGWSSVVDFYPRPVLAFGYCRCLCLSVCPSSKDGQNFSKEQIFLLIDLVIDNSFFRFGNKVFRQKIGIPMGVDPAPQMANLYLYYYETAFMEKLTKQDYSKAKKFNNTSRFIDDLGTLNNDRILVTEKAKIYPVELMLNSLRPSDAYMRR